MSLPFTDWSSKPFWDGLSLSVSYLWTASVRNRPCERSTKSQTEIMYVWTSCHAILFYYNIVPKSWESMCIYVVHCVFFLQDIVRPSFIFFVAKIPPTTQTKKCFPVGWIWSHHHPLLVCFLEVTRSGYCYFFGYEDGSFHQWLKGGL